MSLIVTPENLVKVVPMPTARAISISALINTICPTYGIVDDLVLQAFIAQTAWESEGFSAKSENLNYSAKQLVDVFGKKHFPTMLMAERYAFQPQKIANYVYGGRLGNTLPDSGWNFRGGGFIQLTGYSIYNEYGKRKKIDALAAANLVRTDDAAALDSACWFFAISRNLIPFAKSGAFQALTLRIQGSLSSDPQREAIYAKAKQYLV